MITERHSFMAFTITYIHILLSHTLITNKWTIQKFLSYFLFDFWEKSDFQKSFIKELISFCQNNLVQKVYIYIDKKQ